MILQLLCKILSGTATAVVLSHPIIRPGWNTHSGKRVFIASIITICRSWMVVLGIISLSCSNSRSLNTENQNMSVLTGNWMIVAQNFSPLMIIPNCKPIQHGSTFQFTQDTLKVYSDASQKPCAVYTYKISGNSISIIHADMIWLCNFELSKDTLKITSNHFLTPYETNTGKPVTIPPATEIAVALKKKNT